MITEASVSAAQRDLAGSTSFAQLNGPPEPSNAATSDLTVHHLRVPQQYIGPNFPIAHAAMSPDGVDIAVAGSKGLALYSRRSLKWRLFGDVSQERAFSVRVSSLTLLHFEMSFANIWGILQPRHVPGRRANAGQKSSQMLSPSWPGPSIQAQHTADVCKFMLGTEHRLLIL